MTPPRLSVCVPVHNGGRFIAATLESILSAADEQTEVVVLENASTDDTAEILAQVSDPRVRIETTEGLLPLLDNWRRVVDLSHGSLVKIVCADDLIAPNCLQQQVTILERHAHIALVASRRDIVDGAGRVLEPAVGMRHLIGRHSGREVAEQIARWAINPIGEAGNVMFRRADYEAAGGFRGPLIFPMDIDLWLRLLKRGDLWGQAEPLAAFRTSEDSLSSQHSRHQYRENQAFVRSVVDDPAWTPTTAWRISSELAIPLSWWAWSLRQRGKWPIPAISDRLRSASALPT
jgi:glycosyltransferase involved in cell wall biosynthesis